jgi:ribosomal protein L32
MFWNSLQLVSSLVRQRLTLQYYPVLPALVPQLAGGIPQQLPSSSSSSQQEEQQQHQLQDWIWFAVPKSKISPSRKRMKTTKQKRIPMKKNIVFDHRTGEVTLKHKLPFNWKDYLPKID